jgi:hypothetical protein
MSPEIDEEKLLALLSSLKQRRYASWWLHESAKLASLLGLPFEAVRDCASRMIVAPWDDHPLARPDGLVVEIEFSDGHRRRFLLRIVAPAVELESGT